MSSTLVYLGCQPSTSVAFRLEAISVAGSPGRRPSSRTGMGWPVTRRAASMISRLEKPCPLPRLKVAEVLVRFS